MRRSLGSENTVNPTGGAFRVFSQRKIGYAIDFQFESGMRRMLPYSELIEAEYNPELGALLLEGVGKRVTIYGINLVGLYELIIDHEVGQVIERHEPEHMMATVATRGEPYVRELEWEKL